MKQEEYKTGRVAKKGGTELLEEGGELEREYEELKQIILRKEQSTEPKAEVALNEDKSRERKPIEKKKTWTMKIKGHVAENLYKTFRISNNLGFASILIIVNEFKLVIQFSF